MSIQGSNYNFGLQIISIYIYFFVLKFLKMENFRSKFFIYIKIYYKHKLLFKFPMITLKKCRS